MTVPAPGPTADDPPSIEDVIRTLEGPTVEVDPATGPTADDPPCPGCGGIGHAVDDEDFPCPICNYDDTADVDTADDDLQLIAEWLQAVGYPLNWSAPDHPLPEVLRVPLAQAWQANDDPSVPLDDWVWTLTEEGAW